jgi:hypothetical protein
MPARPAPPVRTGRRIVGLRVARRLGNIPDGGGWRTAGRAQGGRNARASTSARRNCHPVIGYSYLHAASMITPPGLQRDPG